MADPTFQGDIRPLFRQKDRGAMLDHFDLWSYEDVRDRASAILEVLSSGKMPCDGRWRSEDVDLFRRWIASGAGE
jgi:hypothetical protein